MRTRSKLLMAAIAAIALLGMAVSAASARNLENPRFEKGFRIVWTPLTLEAGGRSIRCNVTLEGTYERSSIAKLAGNRIGRVTSANAGECTRGTATALRETLPWEVTYNSFTGTLPVIRTVTQNLIRSSFKAEVEGIACLAQTRTEQPARGIATVESGGAITGYRADESALIETTGGFFCSFGGPSHFAGAASSITVRGGAEAQTIRLI